MQKLQRSKADIALTKNQGESNETQAQSNRTNIRPTVRLYATDMHQGRLHAIFAQRQHVEKFREGQRNLHCVFIDVEKTFDREPWSEMRQLSQRNRSG